MDGASYSAEHIVAEPNLFKLCVIMKSYLRLASSSLEHLITLIPALWNNSSLQLNPGWLTPEEETLPEGDLSRPPPPLFTPPMKILIWNYRGAANPHFRRHLFDLLTVYKPQILVITETRVKGNRG
ncbi:hypothetical protein LOK49_LG05G02348 [Camellia lanceoleosa]|uniref:Uncharacterized protein n=1 Tax=Camellia lanceoleosa TaxID=1840588 RepID=A0ACC0HN50_9ERIC|nr:hypothetical protein LOK49_LG05G02348 [Camellia lanceoleosa]